jgi:hypothetical protein
MIDARLASLSEGGQVRQVDLAVAPKRPLFPRLVWTLPGGLLLGLLGAVAWVLGRSAWSSRVRSTVDAERATGLAAVALRPGAPLLLGAADAGTVVVLAADHRAAGGGGGDGRVGTRAVADALAAHARARGRTAAVVDTSARGRPGDATGEAALRDEMQRAEAAHDLVYVAAPALDDPWAAVVLDRRRAVTVVAAEGGTTRGALTSAADALGRLGVPVLGVVVTPRASASRAGR